MAYYPTMNVCDCGRFRATLGLSYRLVNETWGFDLGERYHLDPFYRVDTLMQIDRAVFERFGDLGIGSDDPKPRPSVEPFGHRFLPAMFGCECAYAADTEPWAKLRFYTDDEILALDDWTWERFESASPLRVTVDQANLLRAKYGPFNSMPDLGSVINTGIYLMGDDLFVAYLDRPHIVRKLYENITQLRLMCMEYFPRLDGRPVSQLHIGNCCVAMISPNGYMSCNLESDRRIVSFCQDRGIELTMHQDSDVTPHLEHYAAMDYIRTFDFGMDTDFEKLADMCPEASVNSIWFPQWLMTHTVDEVRDEVLRQMDSGRRFSRFSFSIHGIDNLTGDDRVRALYNTFKEAALEICDRQ